MLKLKTKKNKYKEGKFKLIYYFRLQHNFDPQLASRFSGFTKLFQAEAFQDL